MSARKPASIYEEERDPGGHPMPILDTYTHTPRAYIYVNTYTAMHTTHIYFRYFITELIKLFYIYKSLESKNESKFSNYTYSI